MRKVFLLAAWLAAAGAALAAPPPVVDGDLPRYQPETRLRGDIVVARTASTGTLVDAWIEGFRQFQPEVTVRQTAQGTDLPAASLQELLDGKVDAAPFVREIQPSELALARQTLGAEPLGIAVASGSYATPSNTHAIAVYVNAGNPLSRLTLTELDAIYSSTRRRGYPAGPHQLGPARPDGRLGRPAHSIFTAWW